MPPEESQLRKLYCPSCGGQMAVDPAHLSLELRCPHCGHTFRPDRGSGIGVPQALPIDPSQISPRSKTVAGLLGILTPIGLHRFYLGFVGIGLLQLLLALGCLRFGKVPVGVIWCVVEGILCFMGRMYDKQGRAVIRS